jgi:hypothetical protein
MGGQDLTQMPGPGATGGGGGGGGFGPWGVEAVLNKEVGDANGTTLLATYDPTKEYVMVVETSALANPLGTTTILALLVGGGSNPPVPGDALPKVFLTDTIAGTIDLNGSEAIVWIRDGGILSGGGSPAALTVLVSSSFISIDLDLGEFNAEFGDMGATGIIFALLSRTRI